jgi:hypothetical protein
VAVSHHGFGKSEGSPTEAGLYTDARNAIEYAQGTLKGVFFNWFTIACLVWLGLVVLSLAVLAKT